MFHGRTVLMRTTTILLACTILTTTAALAAKPPPPPPVEVSGSTSSKYLSTQDRFGDGGLLSLQWWQHSYEARDAWYVVSQVRFVLQPTKGDDIEDYWLHIPAPGFGCTLIDWRPKKNSPGVTLAGSLNLDGDWGINVGGEISGIGVDGAQIESAGPFAHGVGWFVDFDDFSDTAANRVSLEHYALWKCEKEYLMKDPEEGWKKQEWTEYDIKLNDLTVAFQIDDPGFDTDYILQDGKVYENDE